MRMNGYLKKEEIYTSIVSGRGIYQWDGRLTPGPLAGAQAQPASPVITNLITGEVFFAKRFENSVTSISRYARYIFNPPDRKKILWPSDLMLCPESVRNQCSLFDAQDYGVPSAPDGKKVEISVLLFPLKGYPQMVNSEQKLRQAGDLSWKNPAVRDMAVQLVQAVESLNRSGYVYEDFHLSRIFFQENGSAFLDFSNLMYRFDDCNLIGQSAACSPGVHQYPIEFAEPAFVQGKVNSLDFHSQNYSLCALLFYLFFGRYPYDGRLLSGYLDIDKQSHDIKFQHCHKMPVFIFDPNDRQNSLGAFSNEQRITELWADLPESLKELFVLTLSESNATRAVWVCNPPPVTWLRRFRDEGWL